MKISTNQLKLRNKLKTKMLMMKTKNLKLNLQMRAKKKVWTKEITCSKIKTTLMNNPIFNNKKI